MEEPGALAFSPPDKKVVDKMVVDKYHICVDCWPEIRRIFERLNLP